MTASSNITSDIPVNCTERIARGSELLRPADECAVNQGAQPNAPNEAATLVRLGEIIYWIAAVCAVLCAWT